MAITSDDRYLIVTPDAAADEGSYGDNTVYYVDLAVDVPDLWQITPLVATYNAGYRVSQLNQLPNYIDMIFFFNSSLLMSTTLFISSPIQMLQDTKSLAFDLLPLNPNHGRQWFQKIQTMFWIGQRLSTGEFFLTKFFWV